MAGTLKPTDLAKEPLRFPAPVGEYSYLTQQRTSSLGSSGALVTVAGTQTFSNTGRPMDKDND
jgi:hypothetical protein